MNRSMGLLVAFLFWSAAATAFAGSDAATVPESRIPWSGYWWPTNIGRLINGYDGHPSPLEKYDAYATGYYPAEVATYGQENEYDPDAYAWHGHCDNWSAASILFPEPTTAGDLNGVLFNVGDKKGILTISLKERVSATFYGTRFTEEEDNDDIYPGGVEGFHETLISYIKIQGKPIIMDLDPGVQIWNYPAYQYEMEWTDTPGRRNVTCRVWFASDSVAPDYVGTRSFSQTFSYWLAIDDEGELLDEPGGWEGGNHPDFLWYPSSVREAWLMDDDLVENIANATMTLRDDVFEDNDMASQAAPIEVRRKDRFYPAVGFDDDWYRVQLRKGDDFTVFAVSNTSTPLDDMVISIFDPWGYSVGLSLYHGAILDEALETGWYTVAITGVEAESRPYYAIEFYSSPMIWIPHLDFNDGWQEEMTLLLRAGFDKTGRLIYSSNADQDGTGVAFDLHDGEQVGISLNDAFADSLDRRGWARMMPVTTSTSPIGSYRYFRNTERTSFSFNAARATELCLPFVEDSGLKWSGLGLLNTDLSNDAIVTLTAFSSAGSLLDTLDISIPASENRIDLISQLWSGNLPDQTAWIHLASDIPVRGLTMWGDHQQSGNFAMDGLDLMDPSVYSQTLFVPHMDYTNGWDTRLFLVNPGDTAAEVTISGYSRTNGLEGSTLRTIPAKGMVHDTADGLLPQGGSTSHWLRIEADSPLAGFIRYRRAGQQASIRMPNENDRHAIFTITAMPDTTTEWTGIALLNPGDSKTDIWAVPYDAAGNRLLPEGEYLWHNVPWGIAARANATGIADQMFPGIPEETAYMTIYSEQPIIGFGLYGDYYGYYLDQMYFYPEE